MTDRIRELESANEIARNALWRSMFAEHEAPEVVEAQKTVWPEDWARCCKRADAIVAALTPDLPHKGG